MNNSGHANGNGSVVCVNINLACVNWGGSVLPFNH